MIDWYGGSEEDRALVRMWCALRLPVEHRCKGSAHWYPLLYNIETRLDQFLKITKHGPTSSGDKFYAHIQFRLKPDENDPLVRGD